MGRTHHGGGGAPRALRRPPEHMWTLPNLLTLGRALSGLPIALLALGGWWLAAFLLFVAAAATDWLDGHLARSRGELSDFGRFLDPIADKLMVAAAMVALVARDAIGGWAVLAVVLILVRELTVSGLREYLAPRGITVHVLRLAKWKTTAQLVACAVLLLAMARPGLWQLPVAEIGVAALWGAAALTLWTGADYLRAGMRSMTR